MAAKKTTAPKTAPVQTEEIVNVKETVKVEKTPAKTVKAEAPKAETTVKAEKTEKEAAVRKPAAKKAAAKKPAEKKTTKKAVKTTFVVQAAGREVTMEEAIARVKSAWVATGNKEAEIKEIAVYVKPEELSIYYVVNGDVTGRVDF